MSTIVDVAGASAAAAAVGGLVATSSMTISFLAPGRVGPIRAVGTPLRVGKVDAVAEVRVVDLGKENRLMAVGLVTVKLIDPEFRVSFEDF